tara:strand:+ start:204 stop:1064 length:861 start_codon:yes stop_codon:yes gene_type:complete
MFTNRSKIKVLPLTGALGAEIVGLNIANGLKKNERQRIKKAFLDYKVIFFRDQDLSPEKLLDFAKIFGTPGIYPLLNHINGYPEVIELLTNKMDKSNFGSNWHSDTTFMPEPFLGTCLYALETPPHGGDTVFSNMSLAYELLSDGMKKTLNGLSALNSSAQKRLGGREKKMQALSGMKDAYKERENTVIETVHPVVRTHPETGEKALYVNRSHTERFDGMTEQESEPLLEYLFNHSIRSEFLCRFRWKPGSVAVWDNRCTLHQAVGDYKGFRRRMLRVTLDGDKPF